jgi:hypothetical protein
LNQSCYSDSSKWFGVILMFMTNTYFRTQLH